MAYTTISQAAAGLGDTTVSASLARLGTKTTAQTFLNPVARPVYATKIAAPLLSTVSTYTDTTPIAPVDEPMSDGTFYALLGGGALLALGGLWYALK